MDVALLIIDQPEGRNRARTQTQPTRHTLLRCKRQLTLMQALLEVVDGQRLFAIEDHKVVAVALMIAEEEVLAVLRAILTPILTGNLDGRCFGVLIHRILYIVRVIIKR